MGFLKNLLNPKTAARALVDPAGATISAATGTSGAASWIDPSGMIIKSGGGGGGDSVDQSTASTNPVSGDYFGDPGDPSYGSFTDPFTVEDFYDYQDPGYAFELQQGQQALQNSAASQSGALSGAALKDLLGYSQGFARTGYNDAFNRYQTQQGNIFSRLSTIAQLGQNASAGVGSTGAGIVGNAGQNVSNAGGAAGAGIVGAGNAIGGGLSDYWLWKNYGGAGSQMAGSNYSPNASYRVS